jgi:UDP-N-acetylglucosamine 3-dehydrogenase
MLKDLIDMAVIGLGVMGRHHVRVCHELGILKAICDVNKDLVDKFSKDFGVPGYYSVESLLKDSKFISLSDKNKGVSIVTPTEFHSEVTHKCFDAGLNVLLEKPMADNTQDAINLARRASKLRLILAVGYIESFNPAFRAARRLAYDDILGGITSVNIKRVGGSPRSANNVILDLMTHDIGLLFSLFNNPPDNLFVHQHKSHDRSVVDSAQVLMSFGSTSATCEANWVSPVKIREMIITGTEGICKIDLIKQTVHLLKRRSDDSKYFCSEIEPFKNIMSECGESYTESIYSFQQEPLMKEIISFGKAVCFNDLSEIVDGYAATKISSITLDAVKKAELND